MKSLGRFILTFAAAAFSVSCVENISEDPVIDKTPDSEVVEMTFTASYADKTKTVLVNGTEVWWNFWDAISVNGDPFYVTNANEPAPYAEFVGSTGVSEKYHALYPYNPGWIWEKDVTEVYIPINQYASKGNITEDCFISTAVATDECKNLHFKNQLGYIKFSIDENTGPVQSVSVSSNGGEVLGGWGTIDFSGDDPIFKMIEVPTAWPITLLSDSILTPGEYYIALYPDTYSKGLTFTFSDSEGHSVIRSINKEITLEKGVIQNIGLISRLDFAEMPSQREALIAFYNATNGDDWICNTNWCSDKPIYEWYGVTCNSSGGILKEEVEGIYLTDNNLTGYLPSEIGDLVTIKDLWLDSSGQNKIGGTIPKEIGKLKHLKQLYLNHNRLTGSIPAELCNLNLEVCYLGDNMLSGQYPPEIANLLDGIRDYHFELAGNSITGAIPPEVASHPRFEEFWPEFLMGMDCTNPDQLDISDLVIPAPSGVVTTINGADINLKDFYASNKYTVLYNWASWCSYSPAFTTELIPLYKAYKSKGLDILGYVGASSWQFPSDNIETIQAEIDKLGIPWDNIAMTDNDEYYVDNYLCAMFKLLTPDLLVVDHNGNIVLQNLLDVTGRYDRMLSFQEFLVEHLGDADIEDQELYKSTDFSRDGEVEMLQQAKQGRGIDIVLMGDAYSDRLIADGTYISDMQVVADALFEEEPFKSFKDYFNVFVVNVVSENEVYVKGSSTALDTYHVEETLVKGNDSECFRYALNAISSERMDEALLVVVMNQKMHAGTCYMYESLSDGDYGSGTSIAYFMKGFSDSDFVGLIQHESLGHGFAKLADEYAYAENGTIPYDEIIGNYKRLEAKGWWKNVDFTDNPDEVKWSYFLEDDRYASEELGVFEGACTYWSGAYRPSENSIMRLNTGGFNAPSREAIYYRIHKLAYGPYWAYDYEDFVEYDSRNRTSAAQAETVQKRRANYVERTFEPTHPPVIVKGSWRDAVK